MSNTTDNMVDCRLCGSKYCYELLEEGSFMSWNCLFCGFYTNTRMLKNTIELESLLESIPALYRDLKKEDTEGFVWLPAYRNVEGKGEVYADSDGPDSSWYWTAVKHIPIPEEEVGVLKHTDGTPRKYKTDTSTALKFTPYAFFAALKYVGII
jgi:hypothetical protein